MAERLEITDPRVQARLDRAINDLWEFAPDGVVFRLDAQKRKLSERLTKLYREIGYGSRREMLEAYGFSFVIGEQGGGVTKANIGDFLNELERRYSEGRQAASLEQLAEENPDLNVKSSTWRHVIQKELGTTLTKELKRRGILADKSGGSDDGALVEMVEALQASYAAVEDKPASLIELFDRHPEYVPLKKGLSARSQELFGAAAADHLRAVGVLKSNADARDQLDRALSVLRERILSLPESERPVNVGSLVDYAPEYKDVLKRAQKNRDITKEQLQEEGILRLSEAKKREMRRALIAKSLRETTLPELCAIWSWAQLPSSVRSGDPASSLLPVGLVEIDTAAQTETRESLKCVIKGVIEPKLRQAVETQSLPLRAETLMYALWRAGIFSDEDFLIEAGARERFVSLLSEGAEPPHVQLPAEPLTSAFGFS